MANETDEYCTVLVEIMNEEFKAHYKSNYLLQVYTQAGNKIYEKALNSKLCFFYLNQTL